MQLLGCTEQIVRTVCQMTAFDKNAAFGSGSDVAGCLLHFCTRLNGSAADRCGLMQVWRDERAQGEELLQHRR